MWQDAFLSGKEREQPGKKLSQQSDLVNNWVSKLILVLGSKSVYAIYVI